MEELFQNINQIPKEVVVLVVVLFFLLQLFKLIFDWINSSNKLKSDGGVSHLTIYEKIGEQHGTLLMLLHKIENMEHGMEKFERDFLNHTEADEKFAKMIIGKLDVALSKSA
jgi:hypothetical protein